MNAMDVTIITCAMPPKRNENSSPALNMAENTHAQCRPKPMISGTEIFPTPTDSSSRYSIVTCGSLKNSPSEAFAGGPLATLAPIPMSVLQILPQRRRNYRATAKFMTS